MAGSDVYANEEGKGVSLTKRLALSAAVIILVVIAFLMVARALTPSPGPALPATEDRSPNLLSGAVTGLDPGDSVRLHLVQLAGGGLEGSGEMVPGFDVPNGPYQLQGLALTPGHYRLVPEAQDYVHIPQSIMFQVPEEGIVWRYTALDFDFLHPEDAVGRLGLPLCPDLSSPVIAVTPVPDGTDPAPQPEPEPPGPAAPSSDGLCYANHLATVRLVPAGFWGRISGLVEGQKATITLYALPAVPGESSGQGEPPAPESSWTYPPEVTSLAASREIQPDWPLIVTLTVGSGPWGLADPSLAGGKLLVVADAQGGPVQPAAYEVVIYSGKAPGFPGGVDFAFGSAP